jgi:N-acetylglucosamine kinase-like BadF-type ATPase
MTGLIAVDAGQSGIRLRCIDSAVVAEAATAGIITAQPLMPQLAGAVTDFVQAHGLSPTAVGVGSSGLTTPEAGELLGLLSGIGVRKVAVAHDATTSYLGALGDHPGAVIAAGTGVVTLAVGASEIARVDGWGYLLGDAGSGYWIGRAGLTAAMRYYDGRGQATDLLDRLQAEFEHPETAYIELQSDPRWVSRVAAFSLRVDQAAAEGDAVAEQILAEAAAELSDSVITGLRRVGLMGEQPPSVCALGKVFDSPRIRNRFVAYLRLHWPGLELAPPAGTSLDGAALAASLALDSPLLKLVAIAER